jgi:hypothetical protein
VPTVYETPVANTQAAALRGQNRAAYDAFLDDLAARGCDALGYRVTGDTLGRLCVRHLRGAWRGIVAFAEGDVAWVALVGQHTDDPETNVYDLLYAMLATRPEPHEKRTKPPCCDDDQRPPLVGDDIIDRLTRRTRDVFGNRRR